MNTAKKKKKKKGTACRAAKRPRQMKLVDNTPDYARELVKLATRYVDMRDERMACLVKEVKERDLLLQKMKSLKIDRFHYDGLLIELVNKEKVKVRHKNEDDGGDNDDDDDDTQGEEEEAESEMAGAT